MPTGQLWVTNSLGGYLGTPKLSEKLRFAVTPLMKFRQFVDIKEAFGKNKNDKIEFDKISNISTSGGTLVETATMPEANFVITKGTATITEYGNSVPYTGKLDALAEFDVENAVNRVLRDDTAKTVDTAVATQFKDTLAKYVAITSTSGTLTTNGTAGATSTSNLNAYHVKQVVDQLKKWNVPKYDGENYICIGSVNALRGLRDDTATGGWIDAVKYGDPERLFSGEVGKYGGCRFIEETNVLVNTLGSSYGEAVIFGADNVVEAVAIPEELRAKIPTDYGRSRGVAWYALLGWKIMWCSHTDSDTVSTASGWVPRIVHVTSS